MKKIKKNLTKKILVALSIGLITTGIVITTTACSKQNNENTNNNVNAQNVINAQNNVVMPSNIGLTDKTAIKDFIVANKNELFSKTNLQNSSDITKLDVIVQENEIILNFMIKDEFVSNLRIKITKETKTLELNQTYNVKLDPTFNNNSVSAVETIKQTIFKNKETIFLKGTIVDVSDIIVNSNVLNSANNQINVNVTIYGQNFNIALELTPKTPTTGNVLDEINISGQANNISASAYWAVVDKLGLNFLDLISSYNQETMNANLQKNTDFSSLSVKIVDGSSDYLGILKLKLKGTYKTVVIPANTIITVKGFIDFSSPNAINVKSYELNNQKIFEELQTQADIAKWSKQQWIDFSKSINLELRTSLGNVTTSFEQTTTLLNQPYLQTTFDSTNLKIQYDISTKEFVNNVWKPKERIIRGTKPIADLIIDETAALDYLITYKTKLKTTNHSNKYASFYYSEYTRSLSENAEIDLGNTFLELNMNASAQEQFKTKYFSSKNSAFSFNFVIPENSFLIDDFNGKVKFNAFIYYGDSEYRASQSKAEKFFNIDSFKKLNITPNGAGSIIKAGEIFTDSTKLNTTKRVIKNSIKELTDAAKLENSSEILTTNNPEKHLIATDPGEDYLNLYNADVELKIKTEKIEQMKKFFKDGKVNIFDILANENLFSISPTTNLFNNEFFIQSAGIKIDASKNASLSYKKTTKEFTYTLPIIVVITYAPNNYDNNSKNSFEYHDFNLVSVWSGKNQPA